MDESRSREEEWFRLNERELLEQARKAREKREQERRAAETAAERKRLKDLHGGHCPRCGHEMKEEKLEGVTIDRCTFCEGLFFDMGELEDLFLRRAEDRRGFFRKILSI